MYFLFRIFKGDDGDFFFSEIKVKLTGGLEKQMTYRFSYFERAFLKINLIAIDFVLFINYNPSHFNYLRKKNFQLRCGVKNTPRSQSVFFIKWPRKDNSLIPIF